MLLPRFFSESDGFLFSNGSQLRPVTVNMITPETICAIRNQCWLYCRYPATPSTAESRSHPCVCFVFTSPTQGPPPGLEEACIYTLVFGSSTSGALAGIEDFPSSARARAVTANRARCSKETPNSSACSSVIATL
jgi:hypothetical protein